MGKWGKLISFESVSLILLRWIAFNSFSAWFWYHGVEEYNVSSCQQPRVFLFANLPATGHIRTFYRFFTTSTAFWSFVFLCIWLILVLIRIFRKGGVGSVQKITRDTYRRFMGLEDTDDELDRTLTLVFSTLLGNGIVSAFCRGLFSFSSGTGY
jgi:fatty acid desaturase